MGGDLRYDATATQTPGAKTVDQFEMQQTRAYLEAQVIPNRLLFYVDEQVAPGAAVNREGTGLYWSAAHDWYVKAGRMYLPFGFRFEDQSAFRYDVTGTSMYEPDDGAEFGWLRGHWDAQLDVSNGFFAGPATGQGKEYGLQVSYVESAWRFGVAASDDDDPQNRRRIYGVFAGTRTGPVVWLGEVDAVENEFASQEGQARAAGLLEGDWLIARGNNLKLTFKPLDPDRGVPGNGRSRWSLVYELTPVQFMQIRAGVRDCEGPRGLAAENQSLAFVQLRVSF